VKRIVVDFKLKAHPFHYFFQCGMAGIVIFLILYAMDFAGQNKAIVASLGSSTFVIFAAPHSYTARLRSLKGGNLIGLLTGASISLILWLSGTGSGSDWGLYRIIAGAFAVMISMFVMSVTDTEHPPAAGLAMGLVISQWFWGNLLIIVCSVGFLYVVRKHFTRRMLNLY